MGQGHSARSLPKSEIKSLASKTHFTESQIKKWHKSFIAINITQSGTPEEKLGMAFQLYDIDRNGTIEESEMVQIITAIHLMVGEIDQLQGNSPAERTRAIFKKMDVNSDSVLTKEEFIQGCLGDEHLYQLLSQNSPESMD